MLEINGNNVCPVNHVERWFSRAKKKKKIEKSSLEKCLRDKNRDENKFIRPTQRTVILPRVKYRAILKLSTFLTILKRKRGKRKIIDSNDSATVFAQNDPYFLRVDKKD